LLPNDACSCNINRTNGEDEGRVGAKIKVRVRAKIKLRVKAEIKLRVRMRSLSGSSIFLIGFLLLKVLTNSCRKENAAGASLGSKCLESNCRWRASVAGATVAGATVMDSSITVVSYVLTIFPIII
jgi:hypothetical protein